jgi:phosphoribosylformimino-5-aminoimidazole carboxamide ribonucleotide (ProFAR) isomerase
MPGHLDDLANLDVGGRRVAGIIVGRALYEGTVDVADAVRRLTGPRCTP